MGVIVERRAGELSPGFVLAPERYDPRRSLPAGPSRTLGELVSVVTENVTHQSFAPEAPVLVLDTTHAFEGFVIARHASAPARELGSAKRRLLPGDVIVSRLRPYLRQIAYLDASLFALAPGGNEVVASTEFFVLRRRAALDPAALIPYLLSEPVQAALAAGQEGGHHPRFSRGLLESLLIPDAALANAEAWGGRVREASGRVRASWAELRALSEQAADTCATANEPL
jgi:hypothetical protein